MVYGLRGRLPSLGYFALVQTSILILTLALATASTYEKLLYSVV